MTKRVRWLVALTAVVIVAAVSAVAAGGTFFSGDAQGPASFPETDGPSIAYVRTDVGQLTVFGGVVLRNSGDQPLRLISVELAGDVPEEAAEVVELRALDPRTNEGDLVGAARWPFEDYKELSQPLSGYSVLPHNDVELLLIVRPRLAGSWQWPTTEVTYSIRDQTFSDRTESGFMVCAPKHRPCNPTLP